jgi:hypothetical protein
MPNFRRSPGPVAPFLRIHVAQTKAAGGSGKQDGEYLPARVGKARRQRVEGNQ